MNRFTVLDPPLAPGEGLLMNIVADYAHDYRNSPNKSEWIDLINYLNSSEVSESARLVGLYMLGELSAFETSDMVQGFGDWYLMATENEAKNRAILFRECSC